VSEWEKGTLYTASRTWPARRRGALHQIDLLGTGARKRWRIVTNEATIGTWVSDLSDKVDPAPPTPPK
jgi:hypothetical protein